ncbi:hypothetical protein ACSVDA_19465 [Cytobacillus sp. Hm23]
MENMTNSLDYYKGQIVLIKTTIDELIYCKVNHKVHANSDSYNVEALKEEGGLFYDKVINLNQVQRICVLPLDLQKGIELTVNYKPTFNFKETAKLSSIVSFGEIGDKI